MSYITFVPNILESALRKKVKGREYVVAPVVLQTEGVYKNEFVPFEELNNNPESWNGRPVVIGHPMNDAGMPVSANDPDILANYQIGHLYNVRAENNKLRGEVWVDVSMAEGIERGKDVITMLEENIGMMEVSTAYFRAMEFKPGVYDGEYYEGISRDIKPDHLAILLDAVGECSIKDGCGFPRANSKKEVEPMEKTELDEGISLFRRGLVMLSKAFNSKGVSKMDEKIKAIRDSGLVAFSEEELQGFCEDKIDSLLALVEKAKKPAPEPDPATNEDEEDTEPIVDDDAEPVSFKEQLDAEFADFGGLEGVKKVLSGIKANEAEKRDRLLNRLLANELCPLDEATLKSLPVEALESLDKSFVPGDYSAQGGNGSLQAQKNDDYEPYEAPKIFEEEKE